MHTLSMIGGRHRSEPSGQTSGLACRSHLRAVGDGHRQDLGPIELTVEKQKTVNIPLWAGVAAVLAGVVTLSLGRDRWPPGKGTT